MNSSWSVFLNQFEREKQTLVHHAGPAGGLELKATKEEEGSPARPWSLRRSYGGSRGSSCSSLATTTTFRLFPRRRYCCLVETLSGNAAKDSSTLLDSCS